MSEAIIPPVEGSVRGALPGLGRHALRRAVDRVGTASLIVYSGTALYALVFVAAAVLHYIVFRSARPDLGNMVQAIWSTMHGHLLESTTLQGRQVSRLAFHVDPFLLLLVPFYWIWSSPLLLVVVQALAVASGALPVFWLARKHLGSARAGAHFAFAYLLYPATQFNAFTNTSSFHPVAIAVPLVLFAIWFLDEDRLVAFAVVALVGATTKEELPLAIGCLGIWYAVKKGRRAFGLSVFAIGLAITLVDFLVVIPHFSPSGVDPFAGRYSTVGGTPTGVLHTIVTHPLAIVHTVATGHKLFYVVLLLAPFLGLWLLEPLLFLGAVPDLAINLLSSKSDQTVIVFHWTAGIVPFTVAASIFGAARFKGRADSVSLYALLGAASIAVFSPIAISKGDVMQLSSPVRAAKAAALELIPGNAPVAASNQLGGHLSARRYIYTFPWVRSARWVIVDRNDPTYTNEAAYKRSVDRIEASPDWRAVFRSHGIQVLRRLSTAG